MTLSVVTHQSCLKDSALNNGQIISAHSAPHKVVITSESSLGDFFSLVFLCVCFLHLEFISSMIEVFS